MSTGDICKTPLNEFHRKLGARMVPFAGWEMPVQYSGILAEHMAVRQAAGLFDVSHMGEVRVEGPQARAFLNYLVTNDVSKMKPGRVVYSPMCYENGTVVDDLLVHCFSEELFLLCINAANTEKDVAWMKQAVEGFDCSVEDVSAAYCQLAIQGPKAEVILQKLTDTALGEIGYYHFVEGQVRGVDAIISRTGYTGEAGFEVYAAPEQAEALAEAMMEAGEPEGLLPVGLGARDSLRLEAGFPLYGHEISDEITPLEGGVGWTVKLKKAADFIGKQSLAKQKEAGVPRRLVFFSLDDRRIARAGAAVMSGEDVVGTVVSGTHSPILEKPIGSALVKAGVEGDLAVDLRGKRYPMSLQKAPLHKPNS